MDSCDSTGRSHICSDEQWHINMWLSMRLI